MSEKTKIAWCDSTLNFWEGCTKVSAGCANCYAEARDRRFTGGLHWGNGSPRRKSKSAAKDALRLNRACEVCDECGEGWSVAKLAGNLGRCPMCLGEKFHRRRIFSLSLGDWLDPEIPVEWLAEMLDTIRQCENVNWILCTKRPELWEERVGLAQMAAATGSKFPLSDWLARWLSGNPPVNVCALASVENQAMADERIPALLRIPARWRGLSCEPLLGPVDLELQHGCRGCNHPGNIVVHWNQHGRCSRCDGTGHEPSGIHWVIIGGESGPNARPCKVEWIRSLVAQGKAAGVATFVKQLGSKPQRTERLTAGQTVYPHTRDMQLTHSKGGDPDEWPDDLRIQQWPEGL